MKKSIHKFFFVIVFRTCYSLFFLVEERESRETQSLISSLSPSPAASPSPLALSPLLLPLTLTATVESTTPPQKTRKLGNMLTVEKCEKLNFSINFFKQSPPKPLCWNISRLETVEGAVSLYNDAESNGFFAEVAKLFAAMRYVDLYLNHGGRYNETPLTASKHKRTMKLSDRGCDLFQVMNFAGFGMLNLFNCSKITKMTTSSWYHLLQEIKTSNVEKLVELKTTVFHKDWYSQVKALGSTASVAVSLIDDEDESHPSKKFKKN